MKKYLLKSSMLVALAFCSTAMAWADNLVYGFVSNYDGATYSSYLQKISVNLDSLDKGVIKTENIGERVDELSSIKCGVSVGDKYLAFVSTKESEGSVFASINFTTGKVVAINDFSYKYGKPCYNVSSMTYDEVNNKLYAIEKVYGNDDILRTHLYEVNPSDGSITSDVPLDTIYTSIASDHKGGLYLIKNVLKGYYGYPKLVKLNADYTSTLLIDNTKFSVYAESNTLLTSEDGKKVYNFSGVNNLVFDLEGDSVSNVKSKNSFYGLTYGLSSADGETQEKPYEPEKPTRLLTASYVYAGIGKTDDVSVMALTASLPSELDSRHAYYYYDYNGNLISSINYVRDYATTTTFANTSSNESLSKNFFDENGNVVESQAYQWGQYNYESWCWKPNSVGSTKYEYDENNRVAKEIGVDTHYYTYNEDGTVAIDSVESTVTKIRKSVTRYNYANHKVTDYTYDGTYEAYVCYVEYDEAGNKVAEEKHSAATEMDPDGEGYTKFKVDEDGQRILVRTQLQTWEYDGTNVKASKIYTFDETGENKTLVEKISYTPLVEGDYNDVVMRDSTYFAGRWYELYVPQRFVYKDISGVDAEQYKMELQVAENEDVANTAVLAFSLPSLTNMNLPKFVIYRDATPIDTVDVMDVLDPEGMCIYTDSTRLENGTYTYFVQPILEVKKGGDEPGGDIWMSLHDDEPAVDEPAAEEPEYESYYCSNPATITFNTELPHVTDFKMVGGEDVKTGTSFNKKHNYYGIFTWKPAADADKYGLVSNKIYLVGTSVPQDSKVSTTDSISVNFNDDEDVCLVTRYELGYVCSDTISVKLDDVKLAAGVESVTVDGAVKATFSGKVVTLSEPANVAVFAANGQQVYGDENTTSVSLANLPASTYVVIVEKDGKTHAYKYSVK